MKHDFKSNKFVLIIFILSLCIGCASNSERDKIIVDSLFKIALKYDSIDDYHSSITYYDKILSIDSKNIIALQNRGTALIKSNKIQEGFYDLNKAIKLAPSEQTYCTRSFGYLFLNKIDSAEMDLKIAKEYKPYIGNVTVKFKKAQIIKDKSLPSYFHYAKSKLELMKGDTFAALTYCGTADGLEYNGKFSDELKAKISKKYGVEIVSNYNYRKIMGIIDSLPLIKEVRNRSISSDDYSLTKSLEGLDNGVYIIKVDCSSKQFVFKMDARTLKVLNPDGKK